MSLHETLASRFPALQNRTFRRFWTAQIVSLTGTWMQNLSLPWLAYTLTKSPLLLGLVGAAQFLPMMFFSLFAGALTDRLPKRGVVILTQSVQMLSSALLSVLVFTGTAIYPLLLVLALLTGLANTLDFPARQSLMSEIVGREHIMNAIGLNSSVFNAARIFGPALAGLIMGLWGIGWCFLLNSLSFLPAIYSLIRVPRSKGRPVEGPSTGVFRAVLEGLRYLHGEKRLRAILVRVALMSILGFNFTVLIPVLVKQTLGLGEPAYGLIMSCMGVGSLAAALTIAARSAHGPRTRFLWAMPFLTSALFLALGFFHNFIVVCGLMVIVGFSNVSFFTTANSFLQSNAEPAFRGRVLGFYSLLFGGMTPVGNSFAGLLVEWGSPRLGFVVTGGLLGLVMTALLIARKRQDLSSPAAGSSLEPPDSLPPE